VPDKVNVAVAAAAPAPHRWREHGPIAAVLALAAVLLFTNLGRDYLWADEGDTAVLARNILKFGVPTTWDGVSFTDSDYGTRSTDNFLMVSHPWLQYYITAASFALIGETALAARLPFALMGLATIAVVYGLLVRVARNRWAALTASILMTLSVQFLIYARQSRYYALTALLTCALVWQFTRLTSWTRAIGFALLAALLFHSHPIALAPLAALGALTLAYAPYRDMRPWFWRAMPLVAVLTLPWLVFSRTGYAYNTVWLRDLGSFLPRVTQFAIECASVTPIVGTGLLLIVLRRLSRRRPRGKAAARWRPEAVLTADERPLAVALVAIMLAYAVAIALTQSREMIWIAGVRYTTAVIPFAAALAGLAVARASRGRALIGIALVLVFGFTKLGRITPWIFWEPPTAIRDATASVTFHNPERPVDRVLRTSQIGFVQSLIEPDQGTVARVAAFLNEHAAPRDVVVTNYAWEPLYFHTGLPLGMTVLPSYPIWGSVKEHQLPSYVFSQKDARWIVWRQAWGSYRGQDCGRIIENLKAAGASVSLAQSVPETVWENRENIHFRRFPNQHYIYSWFGDLPDTLIYRVDWPAAPARQ